MKKKSILVTVLAVILLLAVLLISCEWGGTTQTSVGQALSAYESATEKQAKTKAVLSVALYNTAGEEIKIGEELNAERKLVGDKFLMTGSAQTTEFNDNASKFLASISTYLGGLGGTGIPTEIKEYLTVKNNKQLMFEIGYSSANGTINARGDYITKGDTPDFKYVWKDQTVSLFAGIKEKDIFDRVGEAGDENDVNIPKIALKDVFMTPSVLPDFEWSAERDEAGGRFNNGTKTYHHRFTLTETEIQDYILKQITTAIDDAFPEKENENYKSITRLISEYKDTVLSWFEFDNLSFVVETDEEGRIVKTATDFNVTVKIPDADIAAIAEKEKIATATAIKSVFSLVHITLGLGNSAQKDKLNTNATEIRVSLSIEETYSYETEISAAYDLLFTPYDSELDGRYKVNFDDEEGEEN